MKVKVFADARSAIGKIEKNLFGSFVEHLGRAVYGGIYEPAHATADKDGYRGDVLQAVKELGVSVVRYPGGNFLSGYDWTDGIGEKSKRPVRLDLAWFTTETNEFGTDEFLGWCKKAGVEPMMAVNMGTGSIKDAARLVEYCNHAGGTELSELRRKNGSDKPYGVKYWCIGNEMDGDWQIGHLTADEYGKKALEAAKVMRWSNGETAGGTAEKDCLKLVVSGSSVRGMPTFPEWDRTVLEHTYGQVDYLSMHQYYMYDETRSRPLESFLGSADDMDAFIRSVKATIEYVRAKLRSAKRVGISFDEWNIWDSSIKRTAPLWAVAPPLYEQSYTFRDALVFAGMMNTLLNHCDAIKIACLAQLVNVIAPISTKTGGGLLKQAIFYPFALCANNASGEALHTVSDTGTFETDNGSARYLNHAVTHDKNRHELCVFLCNYAQESAETELELRTGGNLTAVAYEEMTASSLSDCNTFEAADTVVPHGKELPSIKDGARVCLNLPPMSYSYLKFRY